MIGMHSEIKDIEVKFAESGWELLALSSRLWLEALENNRLTKLIIADLVSAVEAADLECGSCGCEYDGLYIKFLHYCETLEY